MFLLGYDLGSSSIKAALIDVTTGLETGLVQYPDTEMAMQAPQPGWVEQQPADWWAGVGQVTRRLLDKTGVAAGEIAGIGISYQMHGLVLLDEQGEVLRPAIIWCDSRAVEIGERAFAALGQDYCQQHLLQSPGNFTASKLRWVREQEPAVFRKIRHFLLPGDYLAYRMTGELYTTETGLSEGVLWDFKTGQVAQRLLDCYEIPASMLPDRVPVFAQQGRLTATAAGHLGLVAGIPVGYRSGDQPNNALALNVLEPGEVAATGGTSGVVYAVTDSPTFDPEQRVNSFLHVNHRAVQPRIGVLLCINGAGSQYRWLRQLLGEPLTYQQMEQWATTVPAGAEGLQILPFGNGAERMLHNRTLGAQWQGLDFNRHHRAHLCRAVLEGIAFSFAYGMEALQSLGISLRTMRVGNDNLFQSPVFAQTLATLANVHIEVLATTGAAGAALGAGLGLGIFRSTAEALGRSSPVRHYHPEDDRTAYSQAFDQWHKALAQAMQDAED